MLPLNLSNLINEVDAEVKESLEHGRGITSKTIKNKILSRNSWPQNDVNGRFCSVIKSRIHQQMRDRFSRSAKKDNRYELILVHQLLKEDKESLLHQLDQELLNLIICTLKDRRSHGDAFPRWMDSEFHYNATVDALLAEIDFGARASHRGEPINGREVSTTTEASSGQYSNM